ncbi:threonine/serine ThrE exporter family protein [Micropruina sp.]|uniref:threonine/serine ThrE exporter family protein n=1 Tax=Micropruina sp. TaxID=2737536 RepID=UPI0039E4EAD4
MKQQGSRAGQEATLAEQSNAVCRMGSMMLTAGTGSYRVKAAMGRVAQALGIEQLEAQVSLNEIVATTRVDGTFRTQVVEVPVPVVNADRIAALMRVSLRATTGLSAAKLQRQLDQVEAKAQHHPHWVIVAGASVACAAFAFLNNGRWQECLAAGIAAGCGKLFQLLLRRFRLNQLGTVAMASTLACTIYMVFAQVLQWALPQVVQPLHAAAFTSAILFLIPGFPLLTAALDLARFDFISGMSRLLYASMITLAAALGAWLVAWAFGLSPGEIPALELPAGVLLGLRVLASLAGVFGFALTFNTPLRPALAASLIGVAANVPRLAAVDAGGNPLLCAMAATTLVGLLAGIASQRLPAPRIILSVPAVLIMIPGVSTYRALVAMINRDPLQALSNGSAALGIVVALSAGLAVARMVADPAWIQPNPSWTQMPLTHAQQVLRRRAAGVDGEPDGPPPNSTGGGDSSQGRA